MSRGTYADAWPCSCPAGSAKRLHVTIAQLRGKIQNYAWGSHEQLARLMGREQPAAEPEAELWFGAHPVAPSAVLATGEQLDGLIARDARAQLGDFTLERFGRLPFLLKVLAVEQPLSIQAHPSSEQARAGYLRERAQGLSYADPKANYRDDWPKPELLCPLTRFDALCGFRPADRLSRLFDILGGDCFSRARQVLRDEPAPAALRHLVSSWLGAQGEQRVSLVGAGLAACEAARDRDDQAGEDARLALRLSELYPNDPGVLVALTLEHLHLEPGQGLFVPAGVMHAYLGGMAVEVMASSDNVLRGGLTQKHVDVPELVSLLRFAPSPPHVVQLTATDGLEQHYRVDVPHFRVSRIQVEGYRDWCAAARVGPEMIICVAGRISVIGAAAESLALNPGDCAWIDAAEDVYCATGQGCIYRVQVGL